MSGSTIAGAPWSSVRSRGLQTPAFRPRPSWASISMTSRPTCLQPGAGTFRTVPVLGMPWIIEEPIRKSVRSATPCIMAEFFWDSRYDQLSREYDQVGVEFETHRNRAVDCFLARQYDVRAAGSRLTAAGIALSFRY